MCVACWLLLFILWFAMYGVCCVMSVAGSVLLVVRCCLFFVLLVVVACGVLFVALMSVVCRLQFVDYWLLVGVVVR